MLRSPITAKLAFRGRAQIIAVFEVILEVFDDLHYTEEFHRDGAALLIAKAKVDGHDIEIVDHMLLDGEGRIAELTVFFRPLPATAAALRRIGTGLGRRNGAARAAVISTLSAPLAAMAKSGDSIGVRLVKPTLPDG